MLSLLLILISPSFASSDADFTRVRGISDFCRPRCDSSITSITGEEITKIWQKEIDQAPKKPAPTPTITPTPTPDLHIRINRLAKVLEIKKQEWLKCKPNCSTRFIDSVGTVWMDYWEEGKNPMPSKK